MIWIVALCAELVAILPFALGFIVGVSERAFARGRAYGHRERATLIEDEDNDE